MYFICKILLITVKGTVCNLLPFYFVNTLIFHKIKFWAKIRNPVAELAGCCRWAQCTAWWSYVGRPTRTPTTSTSPSSTAISLGRAFLQTYPVPYRYLPTYPCASLSQSVVSRFFLPNYGATITVLRYLGIIFVIKNSVEDSEHFSKDPDLFFCQIYGSGSFLNTILCKIYLR